MRRAIVIGVVILAILVGGVLLAATFVDRPYRFDELDIVDSGATTITIEGVPTTATTP